MIRGSEVRRADHPLDAIFVDRWSPRAMSGEGLETRELMVLFEAARWAPSAFNARPWRTCYAHRDGGDWKVFLGLLNERNQSWARNAAALVLFVSKKTNDRTGEISKTHSFDTGAAWGFFALQGYLKGYAVHAMQGFDHERASVALGIPPQFQPEVMVAVGKPAPKDVLPSALQSMEGPNSRRPLEESVCEGRWVLKS